LAASFYPGVEFFLAVSHNADALPRGTAQKHIFALHAPKSVPSKPKTIRRRILSGLNEASHWLG
jgi:hypothetical protein